MNDSVGVALPAPEAPPASRLSAKYFRWFLVVAALATLLDQVSKIAIRRNLALGDEMPLLPGLMHLSHVLNYGAAWNLLSGQRWLLVGVAIAVIGGVCFLAREMCGRGVRISIALGLILGGAVGNLIDRILFGAVTDFLNLDTPIEFLRTFPVFNGADSALTVGVILLLIDLFFEPRPAE